jgi:hypothetical protein
MVRFLEPVFLPLVRFCAGGGAAGFPPEACIGAEEVDLDVSASVPCAGAGASASEGLPCIDAFISQKKNH